MKGFPKRMNSHDDYVYIRENFEEALWKPVWKNMWEQRKHWMPVKVADTKEGMIEDETHRIIENSDSMGGTVPVDEQGNPIPDAEPIPAKVTYQQEEYVDDPRSDFFLFGFTEGEVKAALGIA